MKNIVLLGFMGTGKTTIAKRIADATELQYVSTDDLIVEEEKASINDIFGTKGENYFRESEKKIVARVSDFDNVVVDAGGGVVTDSRNIANLKKKGVLVSLWASPKDIYKRTSKHGHRPLLNVDDPLKKISELLEKRRPYYERADFHVNTSEVSIDDAVESIIDFAKGKA